MKILYTKKITLQANQDVLLSVSNLTNNGIIPNHTVRGIILIPENSNDDFFIRGMDENSDYIPSNGGLILEELTNLGNKICYVKAPSTINCYLIVKGI